MATASGNPSQKRQKSSVFVNFLPVFWPLLPCTSTCPNEICIIRSHTLARLPRKISARSAHSGPSNRPRRWATRAKNGENRRFFTVFQPLRPRTLPHPNEIQIICSHTIARLPRKISARTAHRGPSNRPQRGATCIIFGLSEPLFQPFDHPNINRSGWFQRYALPVMPNVTTENFVEIGQPTSD